MHLLNFTLNYRFCYVLNFKDRCQKSLFNTQTSQAPVDERPIITTSLYFYLLKTE